MRIRRAFRAMGTAMRAPSPDGGSVGQTDPLGDEEAPKLEGQPIYLVSACYLGNTVPLTEVSSPGESVRDALG